MSLGARSDATGKFPYRFVSSIFCCLLTVLSRFGAVMEEFEVRDALENVFSTKSDLAMAY